MSQSYGHYEYTYPSPIATAPPHNAPYRDSFETEIPLGTPVQNRPLQDFSASERHPHFADRSPSVIPAYPYSDASVASVSSPPSVPTHQAAGYYSPPPKNADINQYNNMPYSPDRHDYGPKIGDEDDRRRDSMNMGVGTTGLLKPLDRNMPNQGFVILESADPQYNAPPRTGPIAWVWGPTRIPIFSWLTALAMAAVLIYEFVQNKNLTGSVIQVQTATQSFNPMIGPSADVLINVGARFVACIRSIPEFPVTEPLACFTEGTTCSLEQICGLGGFKDPSVPDQSFRFVTPIFIHAGIIHYLMNMLTQLRLGAQLERELGPLRFAILYMAAGIWGFVFGALFGSPSRPSMGCSGSLFGLIGFIFVDLLLNWRDTVNPWAEITKLAITTLISLALGLLPGLDNFAHLGGFIVGIVAGVMLIPNRKRATRRFIMFTWVARVIALVLLIIIFVVTIKEFYSVEDPSKICPNCKYLSCIPVSNWCD
ncbi:rhomboid family-domain-containing protein [Umbelopsis sp. PMI_123]|nr:rhomboid family-domain-containing protein [Umbelopsis sp. PMI_123]